MSQDTRKDRRAKIVSLNVRYKSATVDEFIENHSHDVSKGGLFIKTPTPFPPGTLLKFEIRIASDKAVISGVGRVVWKREPTQAGTERPAGMGVKFIKVDESSRATIDRVVGIGAAPGAGGNFESELPEDRTSLPVPPAGPGPSRPPLVRRATMAGLGDGSVRPEAIAAALATSSNPPPANLSGGPGAHPPGSAAAAAALKAMPTVPRPMFPGQLQSLLHEEPVKEPTMMKQAAELLEEALKEAGGSMADIGDNPLFNRPSRRPRPQSTPEAGSANAPTMPPGPGAEDALSATRTLVDASAEEPPVRSLRGTTTAIGLPPPPGVSLRASSTALPAGGVTPPTPPTPRSPSIPPPVEEAAPKSTRSTRPPPIPTPLADAEPETIASESDIAALASESAAAALPLRVDTPPVRPVSARAQLGSSDAQRRSGGGGLIWAGLGVVVVFGLFGSYKMGLFGGGADQPVPSATAADTSAPSASAAPSASVTASASATGTTGASGGTASASASAAPSATTSSKAAAATTATTATATTPTATAAATAVAPRPARKRPKPVPTEDDSTPDTPAAADTPMSTTPTATATTTAAPTATSTPAPTTTATAAPTTTATAVPTATATAKPTATSDSTAAPTATMRRTIGTAAPTTPASDSP